MKHKHHRHHDESEKEHKKHEYAGLSDSHVLHIAQNHQVDNNLEHRLHSRFAKSLPVGVLAIHIKRGLKLKFDAPDLSFTKQDLSIYTRVDVGHQHKCSHIQHCDPKKSYVLIDDIKHFLCEIENNRYHPSNKIVIELVAFEDKDHHKMVGKVEIHLFEILKHLYISDTYKLKRHQAVIGDLEIEFSFAYGWFGYGYANQLVNRKHTPSEQIQHSMFFRQEPHEERKLENINDVASCLPIGHPPFIPFTERCEIGNSARDFDFDVDVHELCRTIDDPILLVKKMRRRMWKLQRQYEDLPTRKERLHYLEKIITPKPDDLLEKKMKKHQADKNQERVADRLQSPDHSDSRQSLDMPRGETPVPLQAIQEARPAAGASGWGAVRDALADSDPMESVADKLGPLMKKDSTMRRSRRTSIVQKLVQKVQARKLVVPKIILTPPTPPALD